MYEILIEFMEIYISECKNPNTIKKLKDLINDAKEGKETFSKLSKDLENLAPF